MSLSIDDLKHLEKLANLEMSEEKLTQRASELGSILEFVGQLQTVDTSGVAETVEVVGLNNVYSEDEINASLSQETALSQAPKSNNGYVLVPAIFEEGDNA